MATTYEKIASVTVGSGGASPIEFASIPQTFDDLELHLSLRDTSGGANAYNCRLEVNLAGSSNTTNRWLQGNGAATASGSGTNIIFLYPGTGSTASTFGNAKIYFPNYSSSSVKKSFSTEAATENNGTTAYLWLAAGLYDFTTAISNLKILADTAQTFAQHSTATLYGIKKS